MHPKPLPLVLDVYFRAKDAAPEPIKPHLVDLGSKRLKRSLALSYPRSRLIHHFPEPTTWASNSCRPRGARTHRRRELIRRRCQWRDGKLWTIFYASRVWSSVIRPNTSVSFTTGQNAVWESVESSAS